MTKSMKKNLKAIFVFLVLLVVFDWIVFTACGATVMASLIVSIVPAFCGCLYLGKCEVKEENNLRVIGIVVLILINMVIFGMAGLSNNDAGEAPIAENHAAVAETVVETTTPVVEEAPAETTASVVEEAPAETTAPVVEEAPAETTAPVVEEAPAETTAPVVEEAPAETTAPVVEKPVVETTTVEQPTVDEEEIPDPVGEIGEQAEEIQTDAVKTELETTEETETTTSKVDEVFINLDEDTDNSEDVIEEEIFEDIDDNEELKEEIFEDTENEKANIEKDTNEEELEEEIFEDDDKIEDTTTDNDADNDQEEEPEPEMVWAQVTTSYEVVDGTVVVTVVSDNIALDGMSVDSNYEVAINGNIITVMLPTNASGVWVVEVSAKNLETPILLQDWFDTIVRPETEETTQPIEPEKVWAQATTSYEVVENKLVVTVNSDVEIINMVVDSNYVATIAGDVIYVELPENSSGLAVVEITAENLKSPLRVETLFDTIEVPADVIIPEPTPVGPVVPDSSNAGNIVAGETTTSELSYVFHMAETIEGITFRTVNVTVTEDAGYSMSEIQSALKVFDINGNDITSQCTMTICGTVIVIDAPLNVNNVNINL